MTGACPTPLRRVVKRIFEEGVTRTGLDRMSRALRNVRGAVLAYHNIIPEDEECYGEHALHIPQDVFRSHLDAIGRTHQVVPLDRLLTENETRGSPRVAITFDDAYRGAVTAGLEETGKRDFPATVFVAPDLLGGVAFWWDRLAADTGAIDKEVREAALGDCAGDQGAILARWPSKTLPDAEYDGSMPKTHLSCTEQELSEAVDEHPEVSVGSHTCRHFCLPACKRRTIEVELKRSDRWLRSRFNDSYLPCVSYPYGRVSDEVIECTQRIYRWGMRIGGGLVPRRRDGEANYTVPRINIPRGMSERALLVRLSGLL